MNENRETDNNLYLSPLWKMINTLKKTDSELTWILTALHTIKFFSTKDPTPVHYTVSRKILEKNGPVENRAVDILARELVHQCEELKKFVEKEIKLDGRIQIINEQDSLVAEESPVNGFTFEKGGCNVLDFLFAKFLKNSFGENGKKASKTILEDSRNRFSILKNSGFNLDHRPKTWDTWILKKPKTSIFSPYLGMLAYVTWKDLCSAQWNKERRNVPALTQGVHPSVAKILSHRTEPKEIHKNFYLIHKDQVIATLPTIDPKLIQLVTKGVGKLNSLYHHKLIRFECRSAFENWATGTSDMRLLYFERGASEICEKLGFKNNKAIEAIKALLHAQAHLEFQFEDGNRGNLIVLNKFRSSLSGREEGISITLGEQLLPGYVFQSSKRNRLLIPVPELPPLISSTNSHGNQASLQMLIMQKFADKSVDLASEGSIIITEKEWNEMAEESGLPMSIFKQTKDRWLNDGDDGARVLVQEEHERFSLGPAYSKEQNFLIDQGHLRAKKQKEGVKSKKSRKKRG